MYKRDRLRCYRGIADYPFHLDGPRISLFSVYLSGKRPARGIDKQLRILFLCLRSKRV